MKALEMLYIDKKWIEEECDISKIPIERVQTMIKDLVEINEAIAELEALQQPIDIFGVIGVSDGEGYITYFKNVEAVEKFIKANSESDCYYGEVITFPTYKGSKIDLEAIYNEKNFL